MAQLTDVVKNLLIINVLMYFVAHMLMPNMGYNTYDLAMFYPTSTFFKPYQIVSHMFMHANISHIFFNMFGLYMFGPPLERIWGSERFLFYYLFAGFGALGLYILVKYVEMNYLGASLNGINVPMLGASGAVFGLLAGFGMKYPNVVIQLLIPPIPMKAKYFVMIYAAIELFLGFSGFNTGIAHFAHLGGALFGFLLILYWDNGKLGV